MVGSRAWPGRGAVAMDACPRPAGKGVRRSAVEGQGMHISGPTAGRRVCAAVIAAMVTCSTAVTGQDLAAAGGTPTPSVPAPKLDWRACVQGSPFDCATAKVPLDYDNPRGRTIELAVVKRKATAPGRRIGTLFFNPGGPGGPGTVQMPQNYESFPREVRERFDIVSWDPRGIGSSTAVNCFASPEEAAHWNASKAAGFPVGERERAAWIAAYKDLARRCERRDPELLRHVSTADTARDLDQLRRATGEPHLTYLGISYGTFLGATYANLFPGKVRAMVLDSDWDPQAWTNHASDNAPRLTTFLRVGSDRTAAATLDRFLALCGFTTTARCAFSAGSPKATRDKFDQLMQRLRKQPVGTSTYARTVADAVTSLYIVHPGWTGPRRQAAEPVAGPRPETVPHYRTHHRSRTRIRTWARNRPPRCSAATAPIHVTPVSTTLWRRPAPLVRVMPDASGRGPPRGAPPGRRSPPTVTAARGTSPRRTPSWWSAPPTTPPLPTQARRPWPRNWPTPACSPTTDTGTRH
uniref:Putative secreted peptidase n=1 Tax=Streptomyces griseochromogenes TaxID=68214 RepID=Q841M4_9ACTN|nr:putative secreted peptidase [Streptomyces griseochromogenes]